MKPIKFEPRYVLFQIRYFTVVMILALSLGTIKYVDARTQLSPVPSMSVVNGSVTCGAIEAQILSQTPLSVANSCTKKIRAVRVCNTLVVHHECKRNLHCSRPTTVAYDFSCLKKKSFLRVSYKLLRHKSIKTKSRKMIIFLPIMDLTWEFF